MDTILGVNRQNKVSSGLNKFNCGHADTSTSAARIENDVYVPGRIMCSATVEYKALTGPQLSALSEKYDLNSMTRAQYGQLLKELRDSGVITQKEFGDGYSGMVPGENAASALPCGQERFDAETLMNDLAERSVTAVEGLKVSEQSNGNANALAASYARLADVFSKIARFSEHTGTLAGPGEKVNENMIDGVRTAAMPGAYASRQVKASAGNGTFQAALAETKKAEKTSQTAIPDFSNMSDRQKLAALAKLHDSTDYSGMTDVEKYKLMNDRFEAAFPHLGSYLGGLYGSAGISFENPLDQANHVKTLPERISEELHRQYSTAGLSKVWKLHKEAYYSGMTENEIIAAINQRHSGGTIADRFDALYEMLDIRVGDASAICSAMSAMEMSVCRVATGSIHSPALGFYSDSQLRAAQGYATGTKVSWAEVKKMALAYAAEFGGRVSEAVGKTVQEAIDELFDNLMNAEKSESNERGNFK